MSKYCSICGKPTGKEGNICEACQDNIRAEATGKYRKTAKETKGTLERSRISERESAKVEKDSSISEQGEEEGKKSHHFKTMAEYLEYLRRKGR
jgi:hypothetical protein